MREENEDRVKRKVMERNYGGNKCKEIRRLIALMDFAIVGFCRVKAMKPSPVVALGESINELII